MPTQGLDIAAYIHCRQEAEARLRRTTPALYRSESGFIYYTLKGAELAHQSDGLRQQFGRQCPLPNR